MINQEVKKRAEARIDCKNPKYSEFADAQVVTDWSREDLDVEPDAEEVEAQMAVNDIRGTITPRRRSTEELHG